MTKYTHQHPAFARVEAFIQEQVNKCRPSAIQLAMQQVIQRGVGLTELNLPTKVAEQVDHLENRMAKRLRRYYGLNGKYVRH